MQGLIATTQAVIEAGQELPFSIYRSIKAQQLRNVTVAKPLLVVVLSGSKVLGLDAPITCRAGHFIFLANNTSVGVRNLPAAGEYMALLIEFELADFEKLVQPEKPAPRYVAGAMTNLVQKTLLQFVQWSALAPPALWPLRRQELLQLLALSGFPQVGGLCVQPTLRHTLYALLAGDQAGQLDAATLASQLAMSESTLRRRLSAEGTHLQAIKDDAKLTRGLHLLQTGFAPIGQIAEQCGYHSQSRFTEKFRQRFGLTPTELRRTRLSEIGQ